MTDTFVQASLEIRAPRAHVASVAGSVKQAAKWLWNPAQIKQISSTRELPDGGIQLVVADGDKLRDKVVEASPDQVTLESEYRPRRSEVQGRHLRLVLDLAPGAATCQVTLGVSFLHRDAPSEEVERRRWRRHCEQCLKRLARLATPE